jgi:hypothetical protein
MEGMEQSMDKKAMVFSVFLIHALSDYWDKPCGKVYQILNDSTIIDNYILPCYDVLHTQGRDYLVEDISGFVREKGIQI